MKVGEGMAYKADLDPTFWRPVDAMLARKHVPIHEVGFGVSCSGGHINPGTMRKHRHATQKTARRIGLNQDLAIV